MYIHTCGHTCRTREMQRPRRKCSAAKHARGRRGSPSGQGMNECSVASPHGPRTYTGVVGKAAERSLQDGLRVAMKAGTRHSDELPVSSSSRDQTRLGVTSKYSSVFRPRPVSTPETISGAGTQGPCCVGLDAQVRCRASEAFRGQFDCAPSTSLRADKFECAPSTSLRADIVVTSLQLGFTGMVGAERFPAQRACTSHLCKTVHRRWHESCRHSIDP